MDHFRLYVNCNVFPRLVLRLIPLMVSLFLVGGCGSSSNSPCPTDQQLINLFNKNNAIFTRLQTDPDNKELHTHLGIRRVTKPNLAAKPTVYWFEMWFIDFIGGGERKGFAYCEQPPHSLVESIDENSKPGSPEQKQLYRRIEGKWYLFYHSID